ncbi:MAG: DUF4231 domain-containing protein [Acidobacteria bacterium]|nr:DUF4231 domain-containing protein [Acidobacteriota bacterium]
MDEAEYLKERVDEQIAWYDGKSRSAQRGFKALRITEIVGAATLPFLTPYSADSFNIRITIGVIGVVLAVGAGLLSLFQMQERWSEYRNTCESLRHEKYMYLTKSEPYDADRPFQLFVNRVESLISKENSSWAQATRAGGQGAGTGASS